MNAMQTPTIPNHHGDHPGFSGIGGLFAGLTMTIGRKALGDLAISLIGLRAGEHVVDIGSGPGVAARRAAAAGAIVTGVEPANVMRRLAGTLTRHSTNPSWVDGVAEALPLDDGTADVVWSIATVHHWPDIEAGLDEVRRVLRPGGRFLALERRTKAGATGLASHGWTEEQAHAFADCCREAGFTAVAVSAPRAGRSAQLAVAAEGPPT